MRSEKAAIAISIAANRKHAAAKGAIQLSFCRCLTTCEG